MIGYANRVLEQVRLFDETSDRLDLVWVIDIDPIGQDGATRLTVYQGTAIGTGWQDVLLTDEILEEDPELVRTWVIPKLLSHVQGRIDEAWKRAMTAEPAGRS